MAGRSLTQLIQDAVELLIAEIEASSPRPANLPTFKSDGTYPGIDINCNAALRNQMELSEGES